MKYKSKILKHVNSISDKCEIVVDHGLAKQEMSADQIVQQMDIMLHEISTLENIVSLEKRDPQFDRVKSDVINRVQTMNNKITLVREGLVKSTLTRDQTIDLVRGIIRHAKNVKSQISNLKDDLGFG